MKVRSWTARRSATPSARASARGWRRWAVVGLGVALAAAGCTNADSGQGSGNGKADTLTIGLDGSVASWAPKDLSGAGADHLRWQPVFDTLVRQRPDGTIEANAAKAFSYNADRTVLTFTLREGMTFTDGAPVDAEAARAFFEYTRDSNLPGAVSWAGMTFKAENALTLTMTLPAPEPNMLSVLATSPLVSPASLKSGDLATNPVGSGPYTLDKGQSTSGSKLVFNKRKDYWNAAAFPYQHVVMRILPDETARLNALRSGQIDVAPVTQAGVSQVESGGFKLLTNTLSWVGIYLLDPQGKTVKPLGDQRVRNAMSMVFDREAIVKSLLKGHGVATNQVFSPQSPAFRQDLLGKHPFDVDAAKRLMAEAGYADGFELTMPVTASNQHLMPVVVQQLGLLNIKVKQVNVPGEQAVTRVFSGEFPALALSFATKTPFSDIEKLRPKSPFNFSKATDPELTPLVEKVLTVADEQEQKQLFQAINARLVDLAWYIPWAFSDNFFALRDGTTAEVFLGQQLPSLYSFKPAG